MRRRANTSHSGSGGAGAGLFVWIYDTASRGFVPDERARDEAVLFVRIFRLKDLSDNTHDVNGAV
jgi:hypothetical protein